MLEHSCAPVCDARAVDVAFPNAQLSGAEVRPHCWDGVLWTDAALGAAVRRLCPIATVAVAATIAVPAGASLSIRYKGLTFAPWSDRQYKLCETYGFRCRCERCVAPDLVRMHPCPEPSCPGFVAPVLDPGLLVPHTAADAGVAPSAKLRESEDFRVKRQRYLTSSGASDGDDEASIRQREAEIHRIAKLTAAVGQTRMALGHHWACYQVFKHTGSISRATGSGTYMCGQVGQKPMPLVLSPPTYTDGESSLLSAASASAALATALSDGTAYRIPSLDITLLRTRCARLSLPQAAARTEAEVLWELHTPRQRVDALLPALLSELEDDVHALTIDASARVRARGGADDTAETPRLSTSSSSSSSSVAAGLERRKQVTSSLISAAFSPYAARFPPRLFDLRTQRPLIPAAVCAVASAMVMHPIGPGADADADAADSVSRLARLRRCFAPGVANGAGETARAVIFHYGHGGRWPWPLELRPESDGTELQPVTQTVAAHARTRALGLQSLAGVARADVAVRSGSLEWCAQIPVPDAGVLAAFKATMAEPITAGGKTPGGGTLSGQPVPPLDTETGLHPGHYLFLDAIETILGISGSSGSGDECGIAHWGPAVSCAAPLTAVDAAALSPAAATAVVAAPHPAAAADKAAASLVAWPVCGDPVGALRAVPHRLHYPGLVSALSSLGPLAVCLLLDSHARRAAVSAPAAEWLLSDLYGMRGALAAHLAWIAERAGRYGVERVAAQPAQWRDVWDELDAKGRAETAGAELGVRLERYWPPKFPAPARMDATGGAGASNGATDNDDDAEDDVVAWRQLSVENFRLAAEASNSGGGFVKESVFRREMYAQLALLKVYRAR
jgi:hypothetical protein